ncbi:MAG: VWA domain-containing protein [Verrucomicrobia bacterium]|nr:VWA domain-containing protein [Cytophagales bacterium]
MNRSELFTQFSPWFFLLCLAAGALYAFILYQKNKIWHKNTNRLLAGFRFVLVSILCFLLMSPFVRQIKNTYEKAAIVLAIDNSASVKLTGDTNQLNIFLQNLDKLTATLKAKNIQTEIQVLNETIEKPSSIKFNQQSTNLSNQLSQIQNNYTNRNLAGVVLITDGIFNQGISPDYLPYNFPVYTIGLGDTVAKKDINLKALYYNKIAYLGNKFPVNAEIQHKGFAGTVVNVTLRQNGTVLESKNLTLGQDNQVQEVNFLVTARQKGMQRLIIEVSPQKTEFTTQNNYRDAFVEVIEGKEKILLLALSPHPDIKAIKYAIEKNENYAFEYQIAGLGTPKEAKYDLVILHQIPDLYNSGLNVAKKFLEQGTPVWYILGSQSNTGQVGNVSNVVRINASISQTDQVTPVFNEKFNLFQFEPEKAAIFLKFPPVSVPFGDFRLSPNAEVILYQKVGSLQTDKPLLVVNKDKDRKSAVMLGEGLWEWRQEEFNLTEKHEAFDELILKIIQYLAAKEDKRKLRINPTTDEFLDSEKITFDVETYNDIYEKIYNQDINLQITNDAGKTTPYQFKNAEVTSRFEVARLPKGIYKFLANARISNKNETTAGEFTVRDLQLEALNTTANHNLLRNLSKKTNGAFFLPSELEKLTAQLTKNPPPDIIQSNEELEEVINLKWLFFVLLALAGLEWGLRKFFGGY